MIAILVGALSLSGCGSSHTSSANSASTAPRLVPIGAGINGPSGLRATVYARGLAYVAGFAFDAAGRLWAAAAGLTGHARDGVYLVAHPGARPQRIIAGLDDPLGLVWIGGRLYVSSVGRVTAYRGFNGTRFTDSQTIVHGPLAGGENNALALAPDGRLVMGITATCDACRPKSKWSGSIVSFRPDGTDLRLYAARIRAPVGLTFYPGSSELFVTMNQRNDLGERTTGDVLAVVSPGTDWRFPDCYQQGGPACAGVPPALAVLDKHAAVGPVVIVDHRLAASSGVAALVGEWQTAKVARVALTKHAHGYTGAASVFLTGLRNPFALALGAGPSLFVGDWGSGIVYRLTPRGS